MGEIKLNLRRKIKTQSNVSNLHSRSSVTFDWAHSARIEIASRTRVYRTGSDRPEVNGVVVGVRKRISLPLQFPQINGLL